MAVKTAGKKKPPSTRKKSGTKPKYNPLYHPQIVYWMANAGLTDEQIAKEFKIVRKTLHNWRRRYPDFDVAMARGNEGPDDRVEKSLFQRAVGYSYPEDHIMQYQGKSVVVHTIKHIAPDVIAQIFYSEIGYRLEKKLSRYYHSGDGLLLAKAISADGHMVKDQRVISPEGTDVETQTEQATLITTKY